MMHPHSPFPSRAVTTVPGRLVLRYRAGADARTAAAWMAREEHYALERCALPEVEVSPRGITFLDDLALGPGEVLLCAFSVPGSRDTFRCVTRVRAVAFAPFSPRSLERAAASPNTTIPRLARPLYQMATVISEFGVGGAEALMRYVESLYDGHPLRAA
jgi:hypothetical protein